MTTLTALSAARLGFASGVAGLTLRTDPSLAEPLRARFERHTPAMSMADGAITIAYRVIPVLDWLIYAVHEPRAHITLNGSLRWELDFGGGVKKLDADLRSMSLRALHVRQGVDRASIALGRPEGTVAVRVDGGASELLVCRPAGVAVRVAVNGGASQLRVDEHRFGAIGGGTRWQSPDYDLATDRYDIFIAGGASRLSVGIH
jgi:hypothetical protein